MEDKLGPIKLARIGPRTCDHVSCGHQTGIGGIALVMPYGPSGVSSPHEVNRPCTTADSLVAFDIIIQYIFSLIFVFYS